MTISIIGTGNVATHLFKALSQSSTPLSPSAPHPSDVSAPIPNTSALSSDSFTQLSDISVRMINSRTLEGLPEHSDVILISVKDDAIGSVAQKVADKADLIAHTSGSVSIDILKGCAKHYGVFYPLQTFSKNSELDYQEIPFFIEGNDTKTVTILKELAQSISPKVFEADSAKRKRLHIAAVFACNFSNHLIAIADDLLQETSLDTPNTEVTSTNDIKSISNSDSDSKSNSEEKLDYKILLPLLKETIRKLDTLTPKEAQTGPAVRNDQKVMSAHEEMLASNPDRLAIYRLLTSSILNTHK